jgi:hypothetical protein
MQTSAQGHDLLKRPYAERQRIVVADDAAVAAEREAEVAAARSGQGVDWGRVVMTGLAGPLAAIAVEVISAAAKARQTGLKVLAVSRTEAQALTLPPGHPRDRVLYVGHPALSPVYYPAASFHRFTFEHKFSEAIRLLMALGATELEVEHVRGWSDDFAASLAVPLPTAAPIEFGAKAEGRRTTASSALFRAKLAGSPHPAVPGDLVWLPHEPTWQQVADGRMKYGLREFQLTVRYDDDYGINAGLKVSAQNVGLELGGNFQEHEATTWKIQGDFMRE